MLLSLTREVVVASCAIAFLALHVLVSARGFKLPRSLPSCHQILRRLRSALTSLKQDPPPRGTREGLIAEKVRCIIMARRVKLFSSLLSPISFWCYAVCVQLLWNILTNKPSLGSFESEILFFLFYLVVQVLKLRPCWITPSSVEMWCSILMFIGIANMSPFSVGTDKMLIMSIGTGALRLCFSLCCRVSVCVIWNLLWLGTLSLHFVKPLAVDFDCDSVALDGPVVLNAEATGSLAVVLTTVIVHSFMQSEAEQQVEAHSSRTGLDASKSLLGTICDAVVELDEGLKLKEYTPSFSAVLLLEAGLPRLGSKLDHLMHSEDDKERFRASMDGGNVHEAGAVADAFHLKLRDSAGNAINMELFHVCFVDSLTDRPQHLVGLREHSDLGMASVRRDEQLPELESQLEVTFDAVALNIITYSAAFTNCFGPRPEAESFEDWLVPGDPVFITFCETVNAFYHNDDPVCFFDLQPLILQMPGDLHHYPKLSNRVSFTLSRGNTQEDPEAPYVIARMLMTFNRGPHSGSACSSSSGRKTRKVQRDLLPRRGTPADVGPKVAISQEETSPVFGPHYDMEAIVDGVCAEEDEVAVQVAVYGRIEETTMARSNL